ncbi:DNA/RNA helicase SEN1 [Rhodotorula paludigena]|uniref:DNA/RNA helicase SEN1 n=1 Tax=Rhodotorula paludigena TaxID=86838 RepID=UPI00317B045D
MATPASASSSRPGSTSAQLAVPPRLQQDLAALRDPARVSDDLWSETTEAALLWLLSLAPSPPSGSSAASAPPPSVKGKERAKVDDDGVALDADLVHWFCGARGAAQCWEPATFCIRLLGMKRVNEVAAWRDSFDRLMHSCPACVDAYQRAKVEFRENYLRHYKPDKSIQTFTKGVESMESASVLAMFASAGFDVPPSSSTSDASWHPTHPASLAAAPPAAVQNVLANSTFYENDDVLEMILSGLPITEPLPLPRSASSGLLALRLHQQRLLRDFADLQLARCTRQASSQDYKKRGLAAVVDSHLGVLASRDRGEPNAATGIRLAYADTRKSFMEGLAVCLSKLSAEAIRDHLVRRAHSLSASLDVVHLVASHLSDTGDHLESVLASFKILLERLGAHFWSVGDDKYEEVVLHAILDNSDFHEAFETDPHLASTSSQNPLDSPWLDWLPPFLLSVAHSPVLFTNSLALIASTFLDRLQQARFDPPARTRALQIALALLTDVFLVSAPAPTPSGSGASTTSSSADLVASAPRYPHAAAAAKVLDLHAATLVAFAFSASYTAPEWTAAADCARAFVAGLTKRDGKAIARAVYNLATFSQQHNERDRREKKRLARVAAGDAAAKAEKELPPVNPPRTVVFAKAVWDQAYATVREGDVKGVAILVQGVAATAQFEKLTSRTWSVKDLVRPQMKAVNDALAAARDPVVEVLMQLADERIDVLLEFLAKPNVVQHVLALLLSPVEAVHNTAQGLVKQAFDVTTRRDVFRCMMAQWPEATLRGLATALQAFQTGAKILPEACGMAKRLVRCFHDVLEVLCDKTDGLLRDPDFVRRGRDFKLQSKLLALWKLMGEALALLFKRTPDWAVYFENDEMTDWMRDAILFGADMLDQIRILETIISGQSLDRFASTGDDIASPTKRTTKESSTAEHMISALADPLEELMAWLRLNDEDLLQHAFNLVMRMVSRFTRSGIALRESTAARLKRISDRPAAGAAQPERRSTILREPELLQIREALEDNDDAVRRRKAGVTEVLEISDDDKPSAASKASLSLRVKGKTTISTSPAQLAKTGFPTGRPGSATSALAKTKARTAPAGVSARPRGVPWTTYSSKKADESESESSGDDDEDAVRGADGKKLTGLALLAKDQKPSIKKTEQRRVKVLSYGDSNGGAAVQTNGRARTIGNLAQSREDQQAIRAMRLRSAQDLSRLHRAILQWDPTCEEDVPPDVNLPDRLPGAFRSPREYFAAFEPLLLTECWEQVRQSKLEALKEGQVLQADIAGRQSVDDFVDIFCTIDHSFIRDRIFFGDADLVWLRQGPRQIFAKIQAVNRKREHMELTLRCHLGNDIHGAGSGLVARTKWEMVKLANLSTVHREYAALQALEFIDLCSEVLNPRPPAALHADGRTIQQTMSAYRVNEPQAIAIHGALRTDGFSLIQGPPGTGKTSTIVGLVGAFIDSRTSAPTNNNTARFSGQAEQTAVPKVLLCAPSNAAVDEVAKRLKEGVRLMDGSLYVPKVVRIGADSAIDISVKDVFIDELVERATSGNKSTTGTSEAQARMQAMRTEIDSLRQDRDLKKMEMDAVVNNDYRRGELNLELKQIKSRIFSLSQQLDSEKDKAQQSRRAMDAEQRKMRLKILSEADVICSTLSGAGHDYMSQLPFDFETVIIDEAAQSIELSSLIPLKYGCTRCILVGDPLQLPPTVISGVAARGGYDRSLFVRVMQRGPQAVHLLSIQYRMHPNISAFPSAAFYQSRLSDGPEMDKKTLQPWHANALFPPYTFYHVEGQEMAGRYHSYTNPVEAAMALAIYDRLRRDYASIDFDYRIGIVTPYKGQVGELKRTFRQKYGDQIISKIAFNTVDGFQGQEKDIIILSCVRGGTADKGVGFLADTRRMNVALTRARSSIWILGDSNKLRFNQYWGQLIGDSETRGLFRKADINTFRSSFSASPVVRQAPVSVVKSHAAAIEMSPAYDASVGSSHARKGGPGPSLVAPTPPHLVAGSPAGLKRPLSAPVAASGAKKPKTEDADGDVEMKPAKPLGLHAIPRRAPPSGVGRPPGAPPPGSSTSAPTTRPPSVQVKKKAPPSLFVPKKRPPPK